MLLLFIFSTPTATPSVYTLSLHDALPIFRVWALPPSAARPGAGAPTRDFFSSSQDDGGAPFTRLYGFVMRVDHIAKSFGDRKSTRLNSSHRCISYAVFCLKKKKKELEIVE